MVPNCKGCAEEFVQALGFQEEEGLHLATEKGKGIAYKGHFRLTMVNGKGKIIAH